MPSDLALYAYSFFGTDAAPPARRAASTERFVAFEQYGNLVCRFLRRLGVREADLDDMVQEVFLVVARREADYDEQGRGRAWMYSICRRIAFSQRRKYARSREKLTDVAPEPAIVATQHACVEDRESLELGMRMLTLLPDSEREIFLLYEVEDLTMAEVARLVGCPLQTAYSRLHRARARVVAAVERAAADDQDEA